MFEVKPYQGKPGEDLFRSPAYFSPEQLRLIFIHQTDRRLHRIGLRLKIEQVAILLVVYFSPAELATPGATARALATRQAATDRSIHTLVQNGYLRLEPDPHTPRVSRVCLTPEGKAILEQALRIN